MKNGGTGTEVPVFPGPCQNVHPQLGKQVNRLINNIWQNQLSVTSYTIFYSIY